MSYEIAGPSSTQNYDRNYIDRRGQVLFSSAFLFSTFMYAIISWDEPYATKLPSSMCIINQPNTLDLNNSQSPIRNRISHLKFKQRLHGRVVVECVVHATIELSALTHHSSM